MSQAKGDEERHMWGHSPTWKDKEETGGTLFVRAASVTPFGCVPHLAAPQLRAGTGEDTIHSGRRRRGGREAPQTYGMRYYSKGTVGLLVCRHMGLFKGQITGSYLFSKSMGLRFKAFLPTCNKQCWLWKIQQCIIFSMQDVTITYYRTFFNILQCVVLYWPKNAKQT